MKNLRRIYGTFDNDTFEFNSDSFEIKEKATISDDGETYEASAQDADGNRFKVYWDIINPEAEDGADACDWSKPFILAFVLD